MKYCIDCGGKIEEEDIFCENCGCKIQVFSVISNLESSMISKRETFSENQKEEMVIKKAINSFQMIIIPVILVFLFIIFLSSKFNNNLPETQTILVGLEKLPKEQTPATVTSLSGKESIKETCNSSPEDNILNLVTIDESSLSGNSNEYISITGRYPVQIREKTPTSIMIWKGKHDLSSVNPVPIDGEVAYRDQTDHGGLYFWVCPSGRFLADLSMNKVLLNEGIYTIGIYHYDSIYTESGYQGDMKSILLTSGILRVVK